jgi:glycosyltransferase involved in cell wall biosynthesis
MHIVIIGDTFPPLKTSGAVMLKHLADELIAQGDLVTVVVPNESQTELIVESTQNQLKVFQVKAFKTKDVPYLQRLFAELSNPYLMWVRLKKSDSFLKTRVDMVIWYSPSIFWGPLVARIKRRWTCPSYLILRDIFPDWAIDLGLISKFNPISFLLKSIANYQYQQANIIGVQSPNNQRYLALHHPELNSKIRVLWNWMREQGSHEKSAIKISETSLAGKEILVYAGNIGIAQGIEVFLSIIKSFQGFNNIGFLFVGRGSEMTELQQKVDSNQLKNVLFYPEITPEQIGDLYGQCSAGIIALDGRHETHNIPGKFVSYMQAGLPVFGLVNAGNDLIELVNSNYLGFIGDACNPGDLSQAAAKFIDQNLNDPNLGHRCKQLSSTLFSPKRTVIEIKSSLL